MKINNPKEEKLLKEYNDILSKIFNKNKDNPPTDWEAFSEANDLFVIKYGLELKNKIVKLFESKLKWNEL